MRGFLPLLAIAVGASSPLMAQNGLPQTAFPAAKAPDAGPLTVLDLGDAGDRMTVPVSIGPNGPYPFIIDTGAERSVVSRELAGRLNLTAGRRVKVTTMAGAGELGTFLLPGLRMNKILPGTIEAPAVDQANLGALGMLGIDALKGHSVSIDFVKNVMEVVASRKRGMTVGADDIVIRAKNVYGQLIVTSASYRGQRISVVIDTGSPITIGNLALLSRVRKPKSLGPINLLAVTGQWVTADYQLLDMIDIGGVRFSNVSIAFADALPFERFGLSDTPALMLGMDSLRLFRRVQIDFANREVRFTLPRSNRSTMPGSLRFGD